MSAGADHLIRPNRRIASCLALLLAVGLGTSEASGQVKRQAPMDRYGDPLPEGAIARLGTVRFRHPDRVHDLAFTPDGKTLASACSDGTLRLWDAATGKETHCFRTHFGLFSGGVFSPDGKTFLAMDNHETIRVWDVASGRELHRLKGMTNVRFALAPDGKTLAVCYNGGEVRLWDLTTGKRMRKLKAAAERNIQSLAFSPDSTILAAGDSATLDDTVRMKKGTSAIRLWDAATGRPLRELTGHTGGVTALTFAPDGRTLVSASHDATLRIWELAAGKRFRTIQVPDDTDPIEAKWGLRKGINYGGVLCVAYSPDGRLLASGSKDGAVRIWDAQSGKELHRLRGHGWEVASVVFSADGKVLASSNGDHTIRLWDANSGKELQPRSGHGWRIDKLAVSPDGRIAATVSHDHIILWSLETQRQLHVLREHTNGVYDVAFSPDGRALASTCADRTVRLWDTATGRELRRLPQHQNWVYSVAFTPVRNMLITGENNGTLHFWDWATGKELRRLPNLYSSYPGLFFQLSSDGKILATKPRNAVHLLDVATGKELRRFGDAWPRFGLSPDGRTLAMQTAGEKIRLLSTATGEELGVLDDRDSPPSYVGDVPYVFSPDGRLLAQIGEGGIELWEVRTGKLRRRFPGHQADIGPLAFSADGKTLLSGSKDTTVLIWDVAGQQEKRPGRLSETELQGFWCDLADGDAEKADRAICTLVATAEQSLPFLQRRVRPAQIADEQRVKRLIADLDSDQFAVRERATQELEQLGEDAESALRQALKKAPSLEARRRMEPLLDQLRGPPRNPNLLRSLRATEIWERIGTPEARQLLQKLAQGAAEARLTQEAKASLERLAERHASKP